MGQSCSKYHQSMEWEIEQNVTLGNIIWRNKIHQILRTAEIMLRQDMLHQNNDTPIFSTTKILLCISTVEILPKSVEMEGKYDNAPGYKKKKTKSSSFLGKIPIKYSRLG